MPRIQRKTRISSGFCVIRPIRAIRVKKYHFDLTTAKFCLKTTVGKSIFPEFVISMSETRRNPYHAIRKVSQSLCSFELTFSRVFRHLPGIFLMDSVLSMADIFCRIMFLKLPLHFPV
jgi:hypothetical protein